MSDDTALPKDSGGYVTEQFGDEDIRLSTGFSWCRSPYPLGQGFTPDTVLAHHREDRSDEESFKRRTRTTREVFAAWA